MVSDDYIKDVIWKCITLAEIRSKLKGFSRSERTGLLEGRLTPLEWIEYNKLNDNFNTFVSEWLERIDNGEIPEEKIPRVMSFIKELEKEYDEDFFKFDRRIIEDTYIEEHTPPSVDLSSYVKDKDVPYGDDADLMIDRKTMGAIEQEMVTLQEETVKFTDSERLWLSGYFLDYYNFLKYRINRDYDVLGDMYSPDTIDEYESSFYSSLKHLDNAIAKTPGLQHDTILFHGGLVDPSLVVGGHGEFKSYVSATFQEISMKGHNKSHEDYWEYEIHAPKGTKGVCGNGRPTYKDYKGETVQSTDGLNQYVFEHEYLLGRKTGFTVESMDYENHRIVVLLD